MARHHKRSREDKRRRSGRLWVGIVLAIIISISDYYSGNKIPFLMVYFIPVVYLTWAVGWQSAMWVACCNVLMWSLVAVISTGDGVALWHPLWNGLRGLVFLGVSYMLTLYKRMEEMEKRWALEDPLTGLANRRAFFLWAQKEIARARRYGYPLTVAMIDIDDFKLINDRWGHDQGDQVLIWMADTLINHLRSNDLVARIGGDEIVVLLSDNTTGSAQAAMAKAYESLNRTSHELGLAVSASIGVASFLRAPITVDEMLRAADRYMYQVKKMGKNSIAYQVINVP